MIRPALPDHEAFRDARAEAWRYALGCLTENRRAKKEGGPATAPNARKEDLNASGYSKSTR